MGRPLKITDALLGRARELVAKGSSVEEAAAELGVGKTQLYARLGSEAGAGAAAAAPTAVSSPPPSKTPPTGEGGGELEAAREEGRREARDLDDRILAARHPAAARELADGRTVAAQGEAALAPWLSRPIAYEAVDPARLHEYALDLLGQVLGEAKVADAGAGRKSALLERATGLLREVRQQLPTQRGPSAEELARAMVDKIGAEAIELVEGYTRQHEDDAARPVPGAPFGRCVTCKAPLAVPPEAAP